MNFVRRRKKFLEKWKNLFEKKNWIILCAEKIYYSMIFENCLLENEISENWSVVVGIWLFYAQLQRPMTRMCSNQNEILISLNDSPHQDLCKENLSD